MFHSLTCPARLSREDAINSIYAFGNEVSDCQNQDNTWRCSSNRNSSAIDSERTVVLQLLEEVDVTSSSSNPGCRGADSPQILEVRLSNKLERRQLL